MPRIIIRRTREFSKRKGTKGRSYLLKEMPVAFWEAAQKKARAERRSMRAVLLTLLRDWVGDQGNGEETTGAGSVDGRGSSSNLPGESEHDSALVRRGELGIREGQQEDTSLQAGLD